ncbi:MAG: hypothetical protein LUD52_04665 [Opitutae bacterium]|nr:hypothetical protein [Opitutae bacterium]
MHTLTPAVIFSITMGCINAIAVFFAFLALGYVCFQLVDIVQELLPPNLDKHVEGMIGALIVMGTCVIMLFQLTMYEKRIKKIDKDLGITPTKEFKISPRIARAPKHAQQVEFQAAEIHSNQKTNFTISIDENTTGSQRTISGSYTINEQKVNWTIIQDG